MLKHVETKYEEYYVDENGNIHGEFKSYYSDGQIYIICNYVNNKLHGEYKSYHSNGKLSAIRNHVNGKNHGEYKFYYSNGQIDIICNYVNDVLHGEYKCYYKNGELIEQVFYIMGKRVDLIIHGMDIDNLTEDDINLLRVIYA